MCFLNHVFKSTSLGANWPRDQSVLFRRVHKFVLTFSDCWTDSKHWVRHIWIWGQDPIMCVAYQRCKLRRANMCPADDRVDICGLSLECSQMLRCIYIYIYIYIYIHPSRPECLRLRVRWLASVLHYTTFVSTWRSALPFIAAARSSALRGA